MAINIYSTEEERYQELKDRTITIVPWNKNTGLTIPNSAGAVKGFAVDLGAKGKMLYFENFSNKVIFNSKSIKKSVSAQDSNHYENLAKLFTVIESVASNAIKIEEEEYRHRDRNKAGYIKSMHQYASGFLDETFIYAVKITIEERYRKNETHTYMMVSVGQIKREESTTRVHPSNDGESVSLWNSPLNLSITDYIKLFNRGQAILIKNFPDNFLNEEQKQIKEQIKKKDVEKDRIMQDFYSKLQEIKDEYLDMSYEMDDEERD